ncbi:unnamed protein product, partial [marine sediment metagenome]
MGQDKLVFTRHGRQGSGSHLDVGPLYVGRHRLTPLQQGVASKSDDNTHGCSPFR